MVKNLYKQNRFTYKVFQNQNDHGKKFYVESLRIFLDLIDNVKSGDPYVK